MTVLTIRDVPDDVRDQLAQEAAGRGQSMQAFLLALVRQQAAFSRNRQLLVEFEQELHTGGGAGPDAPSAADLIRTARAERHEELIRAARAERDEEPGAG